MDTSLRTLPLLVNVLASVGAFFITSFVINSLKHLFLKYNLYGIDLNKKSQKKIPEALGVVSGSIFLITILTLLIISRFPDNQIFKKIDFPENKFVEFIVAWFCILAMVILGFADDCKDLRWRYKVIFPTIATVPLLIVYYVNLNSTWIVVPKPLRFIFGYSIDLWILYYVYMEMLAVFCTNAINILAGINGLEVGQSLIIALSICIFNTVELSSSLWEKHLFSIYFLLPYLATSLALIRYNWYPSKVFVGDTFCYFSGMTFAAVGILGHFSKTVLLFFIPQILNFCYSVPQLFHFVPCPRHRLPKYNSKMDVLHPSVFVFQMDKLNIPGRITMKIFKTLRLVSWTEDKSGIITCNNLTLINFVLILIGPTKEPKLCIIMLLLQIIGTMIAFVIRYPLAHYFYDV